MSVKKLLVHKIVGLKRLMAKQNVGQEIWCQQFFVKKFSVKKVLVEKNFGKKKCVQIYCWSQKIFLSTKFSWDTSVHC